MWIDLNEQKPDEDAGAFVLVWHIYQGCMAVRREEWTKNRFFSHWKPVPTEGWIDARIQAPTAEDGDVWWNCVLAKHSTDGIRVTGWHRVAQDRIYTHWMRLPDPPENHRELTKRKGGWKQ